MVGLRVHGFRGAEEGFRVLGLGCIGVTKIQTNAETCILVKICKASEFRKRLWRLQRFRYGTAVNTNASETHSCLRQPQNLNVP